MACYPLVGLGQRPIQNISGVPQGLFGPSAAGWGCARPAAPKREEARCPAWDGVSLLRCSAARRRRGRLRRARERSK